MSSVVTFEYGRKDMCKLCHFRTCHIKPRRSIAALFDKIKGKKISQIIDRRQFSPFINAAAWKIKYELVKKVKRGASISENNKQKELQFVVLHLRASDRPCALRKLSPQNILKLMTLYGVDNRTLLYVMTNSRVHGGHLTYIKRNSSALSVFTWSDVTIFKHIAFQRMGTYLVYAVELQLQSIADGLIETYPGHKLPNRHNHWGFLAPKVC